MLQSKLQRQALAASSRRIRRNRARERAGLKLIADRSISCSSWPEIENLSTSWSAVCNALVSSLVVCAFCCSVFLGNSHDSVSLVPPLPHNIPPAMALNSAFQDRMQHNGMWYCCKHCSNNKDRCTLLPTITQPYLKTLLSIPVSFLQSLSFVDMNVDLTRKYLGFFTGSISRSSVLEGPLLLTQNLHADDVLPTATNLQNIFTFNLLHNSMYQRFKCMLELPTSVSSFPVLPSACISSIVTHAQHRAPMFGLAQEKNLVPALLGVVTDAHSPDLPYRHSIFKVGTVQRRSDVQEDLFISCDSSNLFSESNALSAETALLPYLFPHGVGFWDGSSSLSQYLKYRMQCMLSVFTMCSLYIVIMFQIRQLETFVKCMQSVHLESEVYEFKRKHPGCTEQQVYEHVTKFIVPDSLPGSPSWHRKHLQDLIHCVNEFGMPSLFLTLTSDEVSETKWTEVTDIENFLQRFLAGRSFADAPVECARVFHERLWLFLTTYIIKPMSGGSRQSGLLGRVQHYLVRYEVQARGSLHAHIILWIHPDDIKQVASEIVAYVPARFSQKDKAWVLPSDPMIQRLFKLVIRKQIHRCLKDGCCARGTCQYGFPYPVSISRDPVYNVTSKRYDYCRLSNEDRNVVPYHPAVLLLWGAHMNLQLVTNESWSYYVLKYSLKTEPVGHLNLNQHLHTALGLPVSETYIKAYYAMHASKPVTTTEMALHLMQIPIIHRDCSVEFISTAPPELRMKPARSPHQQQSGFTRTTYVSSVDKYCARPEQCERLTLYEFYKTCLVTKETRKTYTCLGVDAFGNNVYELPPENHRLVRFTDYHPGHQPEAYCYNLLLKHVPFRSEVDLLSPNNACGSYVLECYLRDILTSTDDLVTHISEYCARHLYSDEAQQRMINTILSNGIGDFLSAPDPASTGMQGSFPKSVLRCSDQQHDVPVVPMQTYKEEFQDIQGLQLTADQLQVFTSIQGKPTGVHVISGVPGAGKTLMAKALTIYFESLGKQLLLCASTGPAACRLSTRALTAHSTFLIPATGQLPVLPPSHTMFQRILAADVILIDEFSMITSHLFNIVMYRIKTSL